MHKVAIFDFALELTKLCVQTCITTYVQVRKGSVKQEKEPKIV